MFKRSKTAYYTNSFPLIKLDRLNPSHHRYIKRKYKAELNQVYPTVKKKKNPSEQGIQHFPQKGIQTTFSQRKVSAIDTITIQFSDETTTCN